MVPDWAQESPPVQIEAPQGGLDALANVGQPGTPNVPPVAAEDVKVTGPDGQPSIGAMEGPAEGPGDRAMLSPEPMPAPPAPEAPGDPRTTFAPTPPTGAPEIPGLSRNPNVSKTTITQNVASPESQAASKDAAAIVEKQIEVERRQSEERQKNLVAEQKAADQQAATQLEKQQRMDALFQEHKARLADLTAKDDAALAAAQGAKFHDYWSDKTTGDRVLAALSVFLGGLGTAYGGENTAMKMLQSNIQRDFDKQKEEIQKKHDFHAVTSKNKAAEQGQLEAELHNVDLQQVAATDAAATQLIAMKAKQGVPLDQAKTDASVLAIQKAANDKRAEIGEKQDARVTQETTSKARGILGGGAGPGALSKLHDFARANPGPENEAKVVAEAERLFPGQKPAQLQTLVAGAVKANADAKAAGAAKPPAGYTDILSGQTLPIEADRTDMRQHNEATAKLKPINTFIGTANKLLDAAQSPQAPEWTAYLGKDTTKQSSSAAAITRLRSAYAAAKGESVGEGNSAHLAHAIPDPPTWPATDARMAAWRQKIQDVTAEMIDLRKEGLANAGVHPDVIERVAAGKSEKSTPSGNKDTAPRSEQPKAEPTRQAKAAAATRVMSDPSAPPAARKRAKEYLQSLGS